VNNYFKFIVIFISNFNNLLIFFSSSFKEEKYKYESVKDESTQDKKAQNEIDRKYSYHEKKVLMCTTCGIHYKSAKDISIEINYRYSNKNKKLYFCKKEMCKKSSINYYPLNALHLF
jgi:hypothetical protein